MQHSVVSILTGAAVATTLAGVAAFSNGIQVTAGLTRAATGAT
jgi:hypothetical protein